VPGPSSALDPHHANPQQVNEGQERVGPAF
jgi:hypothetical protein